MRDATKTITEAQLAAAILRARFGAVWNLVEDPQNDRLIREHKEEIERDAAAIFAALPDAALDVERLRQAMQHQRLGREWELFQKGYVSLWPNIVAAEYARLTEAES